MRALIDTRIQTAWRMPGWNLKWNIQIAACSIGTISILYGAQPTPIESSPKQQASPIAPTTTTKKVGKAQRPGSKKQSRTKKISEDEEINILNTTPVPLNIRFETAAGTTAIEPVAANSSRSITKKRGTTALYAFEGATTMPITPDMITSNQVVIRMPAAPQAPERSMISDERRAEHDMTVSSTADSEGKPTHTATTADTVKTTTEKRDLQY